MARAALEFGPVLVQVARPGYAPKLVCRSCGERCALLSSATVRSPVKSARALRHPAGGVARSRRSGTAKTAAVTGCAWSGGAPPAPPRTWAARFPGVRVILADGEHPMLHRRRRIRPGGRHPRRRTDRRRRVSGGAASRRRADAGSGERCASGRTACAGGRTRRPWPRPARRVVLVGVGGAAGVGMATWRLADYAAAELADRRRLRFPPAVRVATVTGTREAVARAVDGAHEAIGTTDVLGPVDADGRGTRHRALRLRRGTAVAGDPASRGDPRATSAATRRRATAAPALPTLKCGSTMRAVPRMTRAELRSDRPVTLRLVFAGSPGSRPFPASRALAASRHEVVAVDHPRRLRSGQATVADADAGGRGRRGAGHPADQGRTGSMPPPPTAIAALEPDLGVIVAYGGLVREPLLSHAPAGWINLHFSLLPRWRGAAPVQRAIIAGDDVTGAIRVPARARTRRRRRLRPAHRRRIGRRRDGRASCWTSLADPGRSCCAEWSTPSPTARRGPSRSRATSRRAQARRWRTGTIDWTCRRRRGGQPDPRRHAGAGRVHRRVDDARLKILEAVVARGESRLAPGRARGRRASRSLIGTATEPTRTGARAAGRPEGDGRRPTGGAARRSGRGAMARS